MSAAGPVDTQNKLWAQDKSKFGYRMLAKMGWKEGQGLGVNQDGVTSHVRVKRRLCNGGIGTQGRNEAAWRLPGEVAIGFNDILTRIAVESGGNGAGCCGDDVTIPENAAAREEQTLREASREKRSYFGRRSRQKTVSEYSEAQLREIFGGARIVPAERMPVTSRKPAEGRVKKKEKRAKEKKSRKAKKKAAKQARPRRAREVVTVD